MAKIARMIEQAGGPVDPFPKNIDAAMAAAVNWLDKQVLATLAALPEPKREEILTRYPRYRSLIP